MVTFHLTFQVAWGCPGLNSSSIPQFTAYRYMRRPHGLSICFILGGLDPRLQAPKHLGSQAHQADMKTAGGLPGWQLGAHVPSTAGTSCFSYCPAPYLVSLGNVSPNKTEGHVDFSKFLENVGNVFFSLCF